MIAKPKRRTKYARRERFPEFLAWLHCLPCAVDGCDTGDPIEAAHIGDRGFGRKCSDMEAAPFCRGHHRTRNDSLHVSGKRFWETHGIDRDELIASLQKTWLLIKGETSGDTDNDG